MSKIKILTDSTSDLHPDVKQKYNIHVIPLNINFGDDTFKDGVTLVPDAFYRMLKDNPVHPTTSQPSPEDFKKKYQELLKDGSDVISIHVSSKLSGTTQSAAIAKNELQSDRIHIIDSGFASSPLGLMAIECSRAVGKGRDVPYILEMVEKLKKDMQIYFIVDTLEYLQKGGRIGKAAALIGGLLNIKPILTIKDGMVSPFEKVRGIEKVFDKLSRLFEDYRKKNSKTEIALGFAYAADRKQLEKLSNKIDDVYEYNSAFISEIGPVVGTHAGPGALAISFYPKIEH
ncbi:MAG: DegV family protein [Spirochaetes bacterium]|nr:DegV family protein [Spirochaetota bacterium]